MPLPSLAKVLASLAAQPGDDPKAARSYSTAGVQASYSPSDTGQEIGLGLTLPAAALSALPAIDSALATALAPPAPVTPPPTPTPTPTPTPAPAISTTWSPPSIPQHLPHIRLAMLAYGSQLATAADAALLSTAVDLVIGGEPTYASVPAASTVPMLPYANLTQLAADQLTDWLSYASAHNLDPESAFYHTASPAASANRLISQYPGRPVTYPGSPNFIAWADDYCKRRLAAAPRGAGLFLDNSGREFPLIATAVEPIASFVTDYANFLAQLRASVPLLWGNTDASGNDPIVEADPMIFLESFARPFQHNATTFLSNISLLTHLTGLMSPAAQIVVDMGPYVVGSDGRVTGTATYGDPAAQMATLAFYYAMAIPGATWMMAFGGDNPESAWVPNHYWPAMNFNVGAPTGALTLFASGNDPTSPASPMLTYKVFTRQYADALVIVKPVSFSSWGAPPNFGPVDATGATTHTLPGSFKPLNADGTLGAAITSISLKNGDGAILIPAA